VTRFLNFALSSSQCSKDHDDSFFVPKSAVAECATTPPTISWAYCPDTMHLSPFAILPSLFCAPFDENTTTTLRYHPDSQPLGNICDNTVTPFRPCTIYEGSGSYATIIHGAKGGASTQQFLTTMQLVLNPKEDVDFVFWDHSLNDYTQPETAANIIKDEYFDNVLNILPQLAGIGMVFWPERAVPCENETHFLDDSPHALLPVMRHLFDRDGRFANISFISSSLAPVCNKLGCKVVDYISPYTAHPNDGGTAFFADMVIWQFMRYFEAILHDSCASVHHATSTAHVHSEWVTDHINDPKYTFDNMKFQVTHEAMVKSIAIDKNKAIAAGRDVHTNSHKIVASFCMFSPVVAPPPPIGMLSFMCVRRKENVKDNALNVIAVVNTSVPVSWSELHIINLRQRRCAGWIHLGQRTSNRADDEHGFSPTASESCKEGGGPFMDHCPGKDFLGWPIDGSYPHGSVVGKMGGLTSSGSGDGGDAPLPAGIKAVDMVVRISTKFNWRFVKFEPAEKCAPDLIWRDAVTKEWNREGLKRPSPHLLRMGDHFEMETKPSTADEHYLLMWSADRCYPFDARDLYQGHIRGITMRGTLIFRD
jgi:hypothetical protein